MKIGTGKESGGTGGVSQQVQESEEKGELGKKKKIVIKVLVIVVLVLRIILHQKVVVPQVDQLPLQQNQFPKVFLPFH
jgi:hypothetical protein